MRTVPGSNSNTRCLSPGAAAGAMVGCMLQPGSKAPDFAVSDDDGRARTLRDFAGRTLVLWFYPKADTPG